MSFQRVFGGATSHAREWTGRIIDWWRDVGRSHAEFFGTHPQTKSMLEVSRFTEPEMMIALKADANRGG